MLDANEAGIGHNNPPPYDPEALSEHKSKADEFLAVTQQWLGLEKIETEEHAAQVTDQLDGLRGLYKKVDGARKAAKKPHDDAGKAVQAAYSPILTKLQRAADALKPKLGAYVEAKARREAEAKRKAEDEARREAAAAERALREAEASGDISAQVEAEEKAKAAEKAAKEAQKAPDTRVRSASGAGDNDLKPTLSRRAGKLHHFLWSAMSGDDVTHNLDTGFGKDVRRRLHCRPVGIRTHHDRDSRLLSHYISPR